MQNHQISSSQKRKNPAILSCRVLLFHSAESEGFEPPDLLQSTVFKTAAFDHSASSPLQKYKVDLNLQMIFALLFDKKH